MPYESIYGVSIALVALDQEITKLQNIAYPSPTTDNFKVPAIIFLVHDWKPFKVIIMAFIFART